VQASGGEFPDHSTGTANDFVNARIADATEEENAAIVSAPTTELQTIKASRSGKFSNGECRSLVLLDDSGRVIICFLEVILSYATGAEVKQMWLKRPGECRLSMCR
jgi:hypothetical protein